MRKSVPISFIKALALKGSTSDGMYARAWVYWLSQYSDEEIQREDFLEKHKDKYRNVKNIEDIYSYGCSNLFGKAKKKYPNINIDSIKVIEHLNKTVGTAFYTDIKKGATNLQLVSDRLKDGFSVEDCKTVIDKKSNEWMGTDNERFLRPITLFAKTKFENYLSETTTKPKTKFSNFAESINKASTTLGIRKNG